MPDVLKTVGRYEILREVGRGGMAMVYLARQTDLDRFVALKELAAFHASDAAFAQRFLRESRVAGSLSHPNIVTVHDYFEHDGTPYIAMEYVERGSLRPYVGHMSMAQAAGVLEGLLAGLAHAEQHGIVHRDLKPENLMVTVDGRVKIADFGIAKATNQMQTGAFLTATGTTVGTPTYMAPEQAMAQDIGPWTDLYSVGCMAFELFTGRVPFHDSDAPMAILLRHVNEEIAPVKSIDPSVDQGVSDWVEALLVKDPKERTQSATEAWDDFEEIVIGLQGPRWRRSARLSAHAGQVDTPKPLTPAPFEGTGAPESPSDEFQSFAWGQPVTDSGAAAPAPPGPATPPPIDAPPGPLEPEPVDVPTGPPTPPPLAPVGDTPLGDDSGGFVTFGAPTPVTPPPVEAAPAPVTPPAAAAAPPAPAPPPVDAAPPAPAPVTPPPVEAAPLAPVTPPPVEAAAPAPVTPAPVESAPAPDDEDEEGSGFDTYVPPPPPRPPTGDVPTDAPPVPAAPAAAASPAPSTPAPAGASPAPPPPTPAPASPAPTAQAPASAPRPPSPAPPSPAAAPGGPPVAAAVTAGPALGETMMPEALKRRPAEPEREEEPRERRGGALPIVVGVAALVAAIVAGLLIGGSGGEDPPAPTRSSLPVTEASNGPVTVKVPEGYAQLEDGPDIPALGLTDGIGFAPGGEDGGRAVAFGRVDADDSTLLSDGFRRTLGLGAGEVPERTAVSLGPDELQAYRYENLTPEGSERAVTLYVTPNSEGVVTVACVSPPADVEAFKGECEGIADTLQVSSGTPFPVGPDPAYAKTLGAAFSKLERDVAKGRAALGKDGATFTAQGAAARDIQAAYAAAAKRLKAADVSPADVSINAALVKRLEAAAGAWKQAAAAAGDKDKRGFDRSGAAIARSRAQLAETLKGLEAAGYQLGT